MVDIMVEEVVSHDAGIMAAEDFWKSSQCIPFLVLKLSKWSSMEPFASILSNTLRDICFTVQKAWKAIVSVFG